MSDYSVASVCTIVHVTAYIRSTMFEDWNTWELFCEERIKLENGVSKKKRSNAFQNYKQLVINYFSSTIQLTYENMSMNLSNRNKREILVNFQFDYKEF